MGPIPWPSNSINIEAQDWGADEGEPITPKSRNHDRPHLDVEKCVLITHLEGERDYSC